MDKEAIKKKFIDNTSQRFEKHLKRIDEVFDPILLLDWLVEKKIIPETEIKIEVVVEEVNNISFCKNVSKTEAVHIVEATYDIPESTIFYILDKHQQRHK